MMRSIIWFHHDDKPLPCIYISTHYCWRTSNATGGCDQNAHRRTRAAYSIVTSPFVLGASGNIYLYACFDDYHIVGILLPS